MKRVLVAAMFVGLVVAPTPAAHAKATFAAYGGDASGTPVHLVSYTNALTNFANGFIDNRFPLATTHLDSSPAATAAATVADTGPGGGFLDFEANGKLPQTQYALASAPNGTPSSTVTDQGAVITAAATPTSADARAAVLTTTTGGPNAKESPSAPVTTDGDTGQAHVSFDGQSSLAKSASSLGHVSIGGGVVTIDDLTVTASVTATDAGATTSYAINASGVKVVGVPVSVTDKGIGPAGPNPIPVASLNQVLKQAGISLSTVAPVIEHHGPNATIDATGITVTFAAPNPNPSVPTLISKVILGEARAFAFATTETPVPTPVITPLPVEVLPTPTATTPTLQVPLPSVNPPATPPAAEALPAPAATAPQATALQLVSSRSRPTMLLWIYLLWQAIIIANAAAVLWWRRDQRIATAQAGRGRQ